MSTLTFSAWIIICIVFGLAAAVLCLFTLNHIPAVWLCDYDEEPDEALLHEIRFTKKVYGPLTAAILTACFILGFLQYGTTVTFF
jgi:hypothetical protein